MKTTAKELTLILLTLLPYFYLLYLWENLPDTVPIHFALDGQPDGWGSKNLLLYLPLVMGGLIYLLMLAIPYLDPKKRIAEMGEKYYGLRLALTIVMMALAIFIIASAQTGSLKGFILFIILGGMYIFLGNYFQVIRPNYFIGIRTPWTLESAEVWKKTHRFGGKLWVGGGMLVILTAIFSHQSSQFIAFFLGITVFISVVPMIYSFYAFKKTSAT